MTVPLMILAGGSVLAGYLGIPAVIGHLVHVPNVSRTSCTPCSSRRTTRWSRCSRTRCTTRRPSGC